MDLEKIVSKYKDTKEDHYFDFIYKETIKIVEASLYVYTNDRQTIEDLSQEVYMKFVKTIDNYNTKNVKSYLYQIAKTTGIDYVRKVKEIPSLDTSFIPDEAINPYLNFALNHLEKDLKEIFLMKVLLGYTTKKIALLLNLSVKVVNNNYYKAQEILKKELEGISDEIKWF